jgi:hypothetical protein
VTAVVERRESVSPRGVLHFALGLLMELMVPGEVGGTEAQMIRERFPGIRATRTR